MKIESIPTPKRRLTPVGSIKFYCRHICCCNDTISWKKCPITKCTLYPYRMGKRPKEHIKPQKEQIKPIDSPMNFENKVNLGEVGNGK